MKCAAKIQSSGRYAPSALNFLSLVRVERKFFERVDIVFDYIIQEKI